MNKARAKNLDNRNNVIIKQHVEAVSAMSFKSWPPTDAFSFETRIERETRTNSLKISLPLVEIFKKSHHFSYLLC